MAGCHQEQHQAKQPEANKQLATAVMGPRHAGRQLYPPSNIVNSLSLAHGASLTAVRVTFNSQEDSLWILVPFSPS